MLLQSQLFTKTRKESPSDEVAKNARLLIRAGFVHKEVAGVYSLLPLGFRVIEKINKIIREEMNAIGGQEVYLSVLQNPDLWKRTDRWAGEADEIWFRTQLKGGGELGLGFTHEEALTNIMRDHISSYKDLPKYAYQIQTKFRNEARAKSGVLRGREFLMKDLYSFCKTREEQDAFYELVQEAYMKIFTRIGLGDRTYLTFASGGVFSKYSHEFQTLCDTGEDIIFVDEEKRIAVNKEVLNDEVLADLGLSRDTLVKKTAVETGNIFSLGTRFSEGLGLLFRDEKGEQHPVIMGSYGFGPTRVMGVIAEVYGDEKGLSWPATVAPFDAHIVSLEKEGESDVSRRVEELVIKLESEGFDILYDDRNLHAGEKFADSDLIGIPVRIVISSKNVGTDLFEVKLRTENDAKMLSYQELVSLLKR
jgi:prolyl-tRNA synthetase